MIQPSKGNKHQFWHNTTNLDQVRSTILMLTNKVVHSKSYMHIHHKSEQINIRDSFELFGMVIYLIVIVYEVIITLNLSH